MDITEARKLAIALMEEHEVSHWDFRWDRAERRMGAAHFSKLEISMSSKYASVATAEQVRETMLHEIAHVHAGARAGHGPVWKAAARRLGIAPNRCGENPYYQQKMDEAIKASEQSDVVYGIRVLGYENVRLRLVKENRTRNVMVDIATGEQYTVGKSLLFVVDGDSATPSQDERIAANLRDAEGKPVYRRGNTPNRRFALMGTRNRTTVVGDFIDLETGEPYSTLMKYMYLEGTPQPTPQRRVTCYRNEERKGERYEFVKRMDDGVHSTYRNLRTGIVEKFPARVMREERGLELLDALVA